MTTGSRARTTVSKAIIVALLVPMVAVVQARTAGAHTSHPGDLDPSFGGFEGLPPGVVAHHFDFGNNSETPDTVLIQPDGKIVSVGTWSGTTTHAGAGLLARYHVNGTLDGSFDGDGLVVTFGALLGPGQTPDPFHRFPSFTDAVLQPDGKILVSANAGIAPDGDRRGALLRYNVDGSLDQGFAGDGIAFIEADSQCDRAATSASALALRPDGKILVLGASQNAACNESLPYVARFDPNGSADPGFGTVGIVRFAPPVATGVSETALQPDGKLVVAGGTAAGDFSVLRLHGDGSLDHTFDGDGQAVTDLGSFEAARDVVLQPDSKIVVAGGTLTLAGNFALARYRVDGSLDTTFHGDGTLVDDFSDLGVTGARAQGLAVQPDGKLVVAGRAVIDNAQDLAVARYLPNGAPDTAFGNGRLVTTDVDFGTFADEALDVALMPDGRIIPAGPALFEGPISFAAVRYLSDFRCNGAPATIVGSEASDVLGGSSGADVIVGLGGADQIDGGDGADLICGGDGADRVLAGGPGNDIVLGEAGNDSLSGGAGDDVMVGDVGNDSIDGGSGSDVMSGGRGADALSGGDGHDAISGENGNDRLSGGGGDDHLDGGPGTDVCTGGTGSNQLLGCSP